MIKKISKVIEVWSKLIDETTNHQTWSESQRQWIKQNILNNLTTIPPNALYRCMVMLNQKNFYGRFSIIFNQNIKDAVSRTNTEQFIKVMSEATFPEIEDNNYLTKDDAKDLVYGFNSECLALNLLTEQTILSKRPINKLLKDLADKCLSSVCKNSYIAKSQSGNTIWVSESKNSIIVAYPFYYLDLFFQLASGDNYNLYTKQSFQLKIYNNMLKKYQAEISICQKAFELGYKHTYIV